MKKMTIIILLLTLLCGCSRIDEQITGKPKFVTAVEAVFEGDAIRLQRYYTDDEKIRAVLTYLRCLDVYGTISNDTPLPVENHARITISYSDGSSKVYEQRGHQYLRQADGPWRYIEPEQAQELPLILGMMESD